MSIAIETGTAILCDDVRTEENGKGILIGVYSGNILVTEIPFVLPLQLWVNISPLDIGELSVLFRLSFAGKVLVNAGATVEVDHIEDIAIALPRLLIKGENEGQLLVEFKQKDQPDWKVLVKKQILKKQI